MLGAIAGDTIGAPYEFNEYNYKAKDFPLFSEKSSCTDDSVMTVAVADALMRGYGNEEDTEKLMVECMQSFGLAHPWAGYGGRFYNWLFTANPKPYNSWGNGSAMRVSAVGWIYDILEDVEKYAEISARVSHNHPEGIKGAQATAAAIFLARTGKSKQEICDYVEEKYGYPLSTMTCDEIRPTYHMNESCQGTVPQAFCAFREGTDFEDVARTAVSLGGDSDTLSAIACSMAEAFYGIPEDIAKETVDRLPEDMLEVLVKFQKFVEAKKTNSVKESAK